MEVRADGYYWVKVTEKVSDKGGPSCDELIIELFENGEWQCFYAKDDGAFSFIDNDPIKRNVQIKRQAITEPLEQHKKDRAKVSSECDLINMSTVERYLRSLG